MKIKTNIKSGTASWWGRCNSIKSNSIINHPEWTDHNDSDPGITILEK